MKRYLEHDIHDLSFRHGKMVFLSGPRQVGKTTLAKHLMHGRASTAYYNWDDVTFRRQWVKNPTTLVPPARPGSRPLLVLDEIHKAPGWKTRLKGIYDTLPHPCDILVTGSARMDIFKKGGDSMLGRYHALRLHPFSLAEVMGRTLPSPEDFLKNLLGYPDNPALHSRLRRELDRLLTWGGFPEPYIKQDSRLARLWRRHRSDQLVREDIRDLTHLTELGRIELFSSLLPEKVGSPFSVTSLSEDLEVSFPTIQRWTKVFQQLYYVFTVQPYHRNIARSIKKTGKLYLWDWSSVKNHGARLENLVAAHLLKACDYWTDCGFGTFALCLLRDKNGREVDFALVRDNRPWVLVEVKSGGHTAHPALDHFSGMLSPALCIQTGDTFHRGTLPNGKPLVRTPLAWLLSVLP
jgi:predicted AAA+ superfamily ATPase